MGGCFSSTADEDPKKRRGSPESVVASPQQQHDLRDAAAAVDNVSDSISPRSTKSTPRTDADARSVPRDVSPVHDDHLPSAVSALAPSNSSRSSSTSSTVFSTTTPRHSPQNSQQIFDNDEDEEVNGEASLSMRNSRELSDDGGDRDDAFPICTPVVDGAALALVVPTSGEQEHRAAEQQNAPVASSGSPKPAVPVIRGIAAATGQVVLESHQAAVSSEDSFVGGSSMGSNSSSSGSKKNSASDNSLDSLRSFGSLSEADEVVLAVSGALPDDAVAVPPSRSSSGSSSRAFPLYSGGVAAPR